SQPSASLSFSRAPGSSSWSRSGMPSSDRPNERPQPVHARPSPSSRSGLRQKGQRRISKRSIRGANLPPEGSQALRPHTVHTDPPLTLEPVTVAVAALAALPASLLSIWGLLHTSAARHVVAAPRADRWHTRSTPLLGGSGIFAGLLVAVGVGLATGEVHATAKLGGILGGCAILFVAGLLDDVFSLGPITKLVGQGAATAL